MAAQAQDFSTDAQYSAKPSLQPVAHPLCPLTSSEISTTAELIRSIWPANVDIRFKVITLDEPAKKSMVGFLEAEHSGAKLPNIDRKAFVSYYIRNTVSYQKACNVNFEVESRNDSSWRA
jgi:Cu2+-containing amine oxidase